MNPSKFLFFTAYFCKAILTLRHANPCGSIDRQLTSCIDKYDSSFDEDNVL